MGELPSQQPPDWWNISGPLTAYSVRIRSSAAAVTDTRETVEVIGLEEPEGLGRVADQQVLRLLVVLQHHLVVLPADARALVAAERRVRRVGVVAVGPHPAGLDGPAGPVGGGAVPGPDAGAEAVQRVVGDLDRVGEIGERRDRDD